MHSDFDPHVIDNPPMPYEQYRNMMFREWARKAAILIAAMLVTTLILYPWGN